jgi:hypothetical protein
MEIGTNLINTADVTLTPKPTPTIIPTIIPLGYGNLEIKQNPVNSPHEASTKGTQFFNPLLLFIAIAAITFAIIIAIVMAVFLFIMSRKRESDHA